MFEADAAWLERRFKNICLISLASSSTDVYHSSAEEKWVIWVKKTKHKNMEK